jgi:hypothetical protein
LIFKKSKTKGNIFRILSGNSLNYFLSRHAAAFSQSYFLWTVPFKRESLQKFTTSEFFFIKFPCRTLLFTANCKLLNVFEFMIWSIIKSAVSRGGIQQDPSWSTLCPTWALTDLWPTFVM